MPLVTFVEDVTTLDEAVQPFYKETEGGYILDAEPVNGYSVENISGLQSALAKERQSAKSFEKQYKAIQAIQAKWEGMDEPEEIKAALTRLEELSQFDPEKEAERLASEKLEANKKKYETSINKQWEAKLAQITSEYEPIKSKYEVVTKQLEKELVTAAAIKALADEKGKANLLLPHVKGNIRYSQSDTGEFSVHVIDEQGEQRYNTKGLPMTVQELVASYRSVFPEAFESSAKSGGGAQSSKGGAGAIDASKLTPKELVALGRQSRGM